MTLSPPGLPFPRGGAGKEKTEISIIINNYLNFCPKKIVVLLNLSPKVIIHYRLRFHAKTVEHANNGL